MKLLFPPPPALSLAFAPVSFSLSGFIAFFSYWVIVYFFFVLLAGGWGEAVVALFFFSGVVTEIVC